jgi:hypothetical protein
MPRHAGPLTRRDHANTGPGPHGPLAEADINGAKLEGAIMVAVPVPW